MTKILHYVQDDRHSTLHIYPIQEHKNNPGGQNLV